MTACNAFLAHGAAHLLTDTAWFNDRQRVHKFSSKVVTSERLRIAVGETSEGCYPYGRSDRSPQAAASRLLEKAGTQKEALDALPAAAEAAFNDLRIAGQDPSFRLLVALWRLDWREPETYLICCPKFRSSQCRPFTLNRFSNIITPPVPAPPDWTGADVRSEAIRLIEAQHFELFDDGTYRVGGSAELTTVDASGIHTETIVRWPDRVGRKIEPNRRPNCWGRLNRQRRRVLPGVPATLRFRLVPGFGSRLA